MADVEAAIQEMIRAPHIQVSCNLQYADLFLEKLHAPPPSDRVWQMIL